MPDCSCGRAAAPTRSLRTCNAPCGARMPCCHSPRSARWTGRGGLPPTHCAMTISMTNMGITGLLVTAIGLYGVLAVFVAQRRREIGIRMALGATRHTVVRTIVWRSLRTTIIGLVLGLDRISLHDPVPRGRPARRHRRGSRRDSSARSSILATVAFAASYLPARRATKVDPLIVLRQL